MHAYPISQLEIIWQLNNFNVFHIAFENFGNKSFITLRPLNKMDMGAITTGGVSLILGFHEMIFSLQIFYFAIIVGDRILPLKDLDWVIQNTAEAI